MTGVVVTVDLQGFKLKQAKLEAVLDPKTFLKVIGFRLQGFVDESFKTSGRGKWKPIAASTSMIRGDGPPLQVTGKYRASFTTKSDGRTFVEVGSPLKIAEYNEFGTRPHVIRVRTAKSLAAQLPSGKYIFFGKEVRHPGNPPRPVLPTKSEVEKMISETVDGMFAEVNKQ